MSVARPQSNQHPNARPGIGLGRVLSCAPTFKLHASESVQRGQVEQYVFDQFLAAHGAHVREFMPWLLSMSCRERYTATAGIRPATGQHLFLEQYLPIKAERAVSSIAGMPVVRNQIAEIGNLVATQRGCSQLLFLVLAMALKQAGFDWLIFTATTPVFKAITHLGFRLYLIGDANPSLLQNKAMADWGHYYENHPRIVTGNLSDAMGVVTRKPAYTQLISMYQSSIDAISSGIGQNGFHNERYPFAA